MFGTDDDPGIRRTGGKHPRYVDAETGATISDDETLARLDGPQRKPVIPPLTALLRHGPSFAATHRYRRHLSRNHALIGDMGRDALSEEAYLRLYERRFRLRCQARAAVALARIGDDDAIAGLAGGLNSLPEAVLDRLASLSKGGLP